MSGIKSSILMDLRKPGHFREVHKKENCPDSAAAIILCLKVTQEPHTNLLKVS